jgi:2-polyprenyl-6-methoxyphenol hydroxylase-like FAD-dependent oxidoreductase
VTPRRPLLVVTAGCAAASAVGVFLGQGRTVALASALALAAALAAAAALQLRPAGGQRPLPRARDDELPLRLRQITDVLRESEQSEAGVDRSLRPLLVPIAAARLGRRGVDMALAPRRAQELLGDRLWEIVRPDRPSAANRVGRGLAGDDLQEAIERLEQL